MGKIERRPGLKPKGPAPGQIRQGFASSLAREFPDRAVPNRKFRVNSGPINGYGVVEIGPAATVAWIIMDGCRALLITINFSSKIARDYQNA
jgi:hypothetical protein